VADPNARTFGRSVLVADPNARTFGRSVRVVLVIVLKFPAVLRNAPVRVRSLRIFDRSAPVVLVRVPRPQAFGLNGLRPVSRKVAQHVLVVHNDDLAMRLARAAGIVTRLERVRINRRDNNPAMQPAGVAGIVTRLVRVRINRRSNRSRRRDLRGPKRGVERDKGTRASAIALRGEGDLASSNKAHRAQKAYVCFWHKADITTVPNPCLLSG